MFGTEFRPLTFETVLGLENIKEILQGAINKNMVDPAYLFVGSLSSGKTTLARIFARSILCDSRKDDASPCNKCVSCRSFLEDRHPGYIEIDAANNSGKDKIKELLEKLKYESVVHKTIILFDEAHNLSKEAKDALLKEIESDPENIIYIFCTTDVDKMPGTLRSRCIELQLNQPTEADVQKKLVQICKKKSINYEDNAIYSLAKSVGSYYRYAENRLRTISCLGDVTIGNVNKVSPSYYEEVSNLVIYMSYDINKAIETGDFLISRMNVKKIYESMITVLVDSTKFLYGVETPNESYNNILRKVSNQYGDSLFEVLSYIISKTRFSDITFFESDILVMHYKFLRDQFSPKAPSAPRVQPSNVSKSENSTKKSGSRSLSEIAQLSSWKRDEAVRELVQQNKRKKKDDRVEEKFSEVCGAEKENRVPKTSRKTLTPEEFGKRLGGNLNERKV